MVIAVANQKGGVAKTTTALNLAEELSNSFSKRVLLIDSDPQPSLTISMGIEPNMCEFNTYTVVKGNPIENAIITINPFLSLIPSHKYLAAGEVLITSLKLGREMVYTKALKPILAAYDYIFIDCPPNLDYLTINALVACDQVIIPMACEYLAFRGYETLLELIEMLKIYNPAIEIMGVLPTMYDGRTSHCREILQEIKENHKAFKTVIKKSIKFADSAMTGVNVGKLDKELGKLYKHLAMEVLQV